MTYKTILLHLDGGNRRAERLSIAFDLAQSIDAHLVGLYVPAPLFLPSYALGEIEPVIRLIERRRAETLQAAQQEFRNAVSRTGWTKTEWRASRSDDPVAAMRLSARYADLTIIGQPEGRERSVEAMPPWFAADVILSAGRPVLLVPYAGHFRSVGQRVLIAWNAGRESARAVTDALPFLKSARSVDIVAFDPDREGDHGEVPGADVAAWLSRHGVRVSASEQRGAEIDVGEQILSRAADNEADLIVMGAYGHSRLRELVLGGVTRTLLESMTVPVLMSH